ncbi:MAG: NADH-quinone oxidoreductase subunit M [Candidatus Omnitrophica bacterium]|nr:NADH-quinone oxidoreductase subunit M [Candidatus Omnitrophota bacterium]
MTFPILTYILLSPMIGMLAILLTPRSKEQLIRQIALVSALATLVLSLLLFTRFIPNQAGFQFLEQTPWLSTLGIHYANGIDGLSITMILLTAIVIFTGVICSWTVTYRVKDFFALMLFLVTGVFGVFMTTNLFFFFLFYEVAVLPMYLLILVWGSTHKEYAAAKLTLYLLLGSAFILTAFLAIYALPQAHTFDLLAIKNQVQFSPEFQKLFYPFLFFGFGVLAGCFPFHVWSPDGHVAAPTAASMLHAGVLMKLGAYGILRIGLFLFPEGAHFWAPYTAILALMNIVYGALVASQQKDLKYVIGYSSVSHMGIVLLGISTLSINGINGAIFQMFSHGIMTALFFACVGFIYDHYHTRQFDELGGLAKTMPRLATFFILGGLCGLGLPGMSGFVAELLVTLGTVQTYPVIGIISIIGLVITAYYVLSAVQAVFYGKHTRHHAPAPDLRPWQFFPRAVLIAVLILFGVWPQLFLNWIDFSTRLLVGSL